MTTYTIRYLCNLAMPKFLEGYQPEHEVVEAGVIDQIDAADELEACERAFMYWNRDDRPNGQTAPSLSVGDVVHLVSRGRDHYFKCVDVGFEPIDAPIEIHTGDKTPADLIHERLENRVERVKAMFAPGGPTVELPSFKIPRDDDG